MARFLGPLLAGLLVGIVVGAGVVWLLEPTGGTPSSADAAAMTRRPDTRSNARADAR